MPLRLPRLPSLCAVCHGWGGERVCAACVARFATAQPRCERCALGVPPGVAICGACLANPPPFERALAAVDYAFPWDGLITRFKFHAALDMVPALAQRLVDAAQKSEMPVPTLMLPVPLSVERLRERGCNQAWELVKQLGRHLRCRTDAALLLRVRDTPHQLARPLDERAANVRAAFAVEPRRVAELRGQTVTLVDDVMTTGATAGEISRVMLQAGAARVHVWVVARTPRPGDS